MNAIDTILALSSIILMIELCQLGVMVRNWKRSYDNEQRVKHLMESLGIDPDKSPDYQIRPSEITDD